MTAGKALLLGLSVGAYAKIVRPWFSTWGCDYDDATKTLPGDNIVGRPKYQQTHAVEISAPPSAVWPWIVQIGQGRGGLYSYDQLENALGLDFQSADRILPEFQHVEVGDEIRLTPKGFKVDLVLQVASVEAEKSLVLKAPGFPEEAFQNGLAYPSWAFVLEPTTTGTKLISRFRSDFDPSPAAYITNKYGLEPVHFLMERKMMLGVKERVEQSLVDVR